MNTGGDGPPGDTADARRAGDTDASASAGDTRLGTILVAGVDLFAALRRLAAGLFELVAAEARILRASVGVVVLGGVALVAFAVSLWICVVALIGWALTLATGSVGIALALLVALHLVLLGGAWFAIRYVVRRASFPESRAEFRAAGQALRGDLDRFQRASAGAKPTREPTP